MVPLEIQPSVRNLADRIMNGVPMDDALRSCASEIDDPSAEDVICALRLAATVRSQNLVDVLTALAEATREDVSMRLRVEASRASARSGVRIVILFSVIFAALLTIAARSYLAPFGTAAGQCVLALVGACYAAGLWLMARLVNPPSVRPTRARAGVT
jgi:Flp pilus assembly protein TadB